MKYLPFVLLCVVLTAACGAGHPNVKSITVTPATATATTQGSVGFTATGIFTDNTSRILTPADGLSWRSSNTAVASIDDAGLASCNTAGSVTVTASAPVNLQLTVSNGIDNTAQTVRGTGTLNCT
jgi:Bacterial Ig-like domain (group 2)